MCYWIQSSYVVSAAVFEDDLISACINEGLHHPPVHSRRFAKYLLEVDFGKIRDHSAVVELAACAWLDPSIISKERQLYMDVDLSHGPSYATRSLGQKTSSQLPVFNSSMLR